MLIPVRDCVIRSESHGWLHSRDPLANQVMEALNMVDETIAEETRVCTRCGEPKPLAGFGKMARYPEKLSKTCKTCITARQRGWDAKNRETHKAGPAGEPPSVCRTCEQPRNPEEFGLRSNGTTGWDSTCLPCARARDKARYARSTDKRREQAKWGAVKLRFGLTKEQWHAVFVEQDGKCAICRSGMLETVRGSRDKRGPCVDHDHKTGKVRGMLCARCNQGIGLLQDSARIAERAAAYLRKHADE